MDTDLAPRHLLDIPPAVLEAELADAGVKAFRARQIVKWIFQKGVTDFAQMTDLPADLRQQLPHRYRILTGQVVRKTVSKDRTVKLLLELPDAQRVETVLIPSRKRATACLSTQIGCPMGCTFCATAMDGFVRNLTAGEIIEQVLHLNQAHRLDVTHVVFMGMGEPLLNYDALVESIAALTDPAQFGLSARRITVSTVGHPEAIRDLAAEAWPITLAISLHAPNDELRRQLVPAAKNTSIDELIEAGQAFFEARGREVTLEYVMLDGVNDSIEHADQLAELAARLRCTVNLIGYNPTEGLKFAPSTDVAIKAFKQRLGQRQVRATVRQSRGRDASAACGQLRRNSPR